jgi:hypothetical protein
VARGSVLLFAAGAAALLCTSTSTNFVFSCKRTDVKNKWFTSTKERIQKRKEFYFKILQVISFFPALKNDQT